MNRTLHRIVIATFMVLGVVAGVYQLTRHDTERPDRPGHTGGEPAVRSVSDATMTVETRMVQQPEGPSGLGTPKDGAPVASAGPTGRIEGIVHTSDGHPAAATVTASPVGTSLANVSAHCAADGTFAMQVPSGEWVVRAELSGQVSNPVVLAVAEGQTSRLDLVLQTAGGITGVVTGPDGQPVAGAAVTATFLSAAEGATAVDQASHAGSTGSAVTDAQGHYRVSVIPGTQIVKAELTGFGPDFGRAVVPLNGETQCDLALAKSLRITGRVTDKAGQPIAGASVTGDWYGQGEDDSGGAYSRSAASDADGRYALDDLREGLHNLSATARWCIADSKHQIAARTSNVDFVLTRVGRIEGRVVRKSDGSPIDAPSIACRLISEQAREQNSCTVGTGGTFVVEGVDVGMHVVTAHAKGFAPGESAEIDVAAEQTVSGVVIELSPGETLHGTVLSAIARQTVAGATIVRLMKMGMMDMDADTMSPDHYDACKTDGEGRFTMANLPPGRHRIRASHEDYASADRTIEIVEGRDTEEEVLLGEGARIHGQVLDHEGRPRSGANISMKDMAFTDQKAAQTDQDGKYELKGLAPGAYMLVLYETDEKNAADPKMVTRSVQVEEGESVEVNFTPTDGVRVYGTVRQGGRVKGNTTLQFIATSGGGARMSAQTDESGNYEMTGGMPGEYSVAVDMIMANCTIPEGQFEVRQDFDLATGMVSGHAYDVLSRASVVGAEVSAYHTGDVKGGMAGLLEQYAGSAHTDAEGAYALSGLDAGEYILQVTMQGYAAEMSDPFTLPADGNVGGKDFLLSVGAEIVGVVRDDQQRPIAEATFSLRDMKTRTPVGSSEVRGTQSDEQGRFRLPGIRAGEYILGVHAVGYASMQTVVRVTSGPDPSVDVTLPAAGTIRVVARDAAVAAVANATLALYDASGNLVESAVGYDDLFDPSRLKTDIDGYVERGGIAPGHYRGEVTNGTLFGSFEVDIVADQVAEAGVVLQDGR